MTRLSIMKTDPFYWNGLNIRDVTANTDTLSSFAYIEVNPCTSHVITYSKKLEKYYLVLSGQLHFYLEGSEFVLSRNDFCVVPANHKFAYANKTNKKVEILLMHTPRFDMEQEVFEGEYFKKMSIFHLVKASEYKSNLKNGHYFCPSLQNEGFIHFCDFNQLKDVANHYYKDELELSLLDVNPALVESELRYEDLSNGNTYYPHLYGPLNLSAISSIVTIRKINGSFDLEKALGDGDKSHF